MKKALTDFRKAIESDEETAFYANQCKYSIDKSDLAYYDRVKWNIMKDATNVRFGNYKYTFWNQMGRIDRPILSTLKYLLQWHKHLEHKS